MQGDPYYDRFLSRLVLVSCLTSLIVVSDNLVLFYIATILSNALLVRLMIHNLKWQAAFNSGIIAAKNFTLGAFFLAIGFTALYCSTGHVSIKAIAACNGSMPYIIIAKVFLLLAAFTQSAIWPFHRWLISSLNSPTPVSAMMHAGLINGGGFLLVRFSFLYIDSPWLLTTTFVVGFITACIGTVWKLMQNDVKRMLACSTMGQMGFMFVECGLGLFSVAMLHLFLHGLFKAYFFLGSCGVSQSKKIDLDYPPTLSSFFLSLLGGLVGCYGFAYMSGKSWKHFDSNLIMLFLVMILFTQFVLSFLSEKPRAKIILLLGFVFLLGCLYGGIMNALEHLFDAAILLNPQPLSIIHWLGLFILFLGWLATFFLSRLDSLVTVFPWLLGIYVKIFNSSQPNASTITSNHNSYNCLK